jgi:hypothetical protein
MCAHGGTVVLTPRQTVVTIDGGAALCGGDLEGAPIVGCAQPPSPATKPCTSVVSVLPRSTAHEVTVGGRPPYVATLQGLTDGVPLATLVVSFPGQTTVVS